MEYGCIGEKLRHSFSKTIHGLLADYDYELKEIKKGDLDEFFRCRKFKAINVTIPYKQDVIKYLDWIDDTAKKIGAVNTVVNNDGKLYGYNTDFLGLKALIEKENVSLNGKRVLILGSGGTSKTALAVAESMGASQIHRVSRKKQDGFITYDEAKSEYGNGEIIINTTPCGMYPEIGVSPINIANFKKLEAVIDVVYNPISSALVVDAETVGIKAVGGLYMLVAQAVFAAEKFLGKKFELSEIDRIFKKVSREKENIVLIGMPSSGKSSLGKEIAKILGREFYDSDEEIVKQEGMEIPLIFEKNGEKYFRDVEHRIIKELSIKQSVVIATGGGVVLRRENVNLLRENGKIIFIDRPLQDLIATENRPLSSSRQMLEERYKERYEIYLNSADVRIDAKYNLQDNIKALKEVL